MVADYITKYMAMQIEQLKMKYTDVVEKYPDKKEAIDNILTEDNMQHLIEN